MNSTKFNAKCDQTIERFQKKHIIAICVEKDTRIRSSEALSLLINMSNNYNLANFTKELFAKPLFLAAAKLNNIPENLAYFDDDCRKQVTELAKYYKDKNINHFVNLWIEKTYFSNEIIVPDVKFIEQYAFLVHSKAFIIKVKGEKETRDFKQPLIPNISNPNFVLPIDKITDAPTILNLCNKIQNFMTKKDEKYKIPTIKTKRKRI